jgi:hypothetical protein
MGLESASSAFRAPPLLAPGGGAGGTRVLPLLDVGRRYRRRSAIAELDPHQNRHNSLVRNRVKIRHAVKRPRPPGLIRFRRRSCIPLLLAADHAPLLLTIGPEASGLVDGRSAEKRQRTSGGSAPLRKPRHCSSPPRKDRHRSHPGTRPVAACAK